MREPVDDCEDWTDCPECGGDGGFDEPAACLPTWIECEHCEGTGQVVRQYLEAGEERCSEEA